MRAENAKNDGNGRGEGRMVKVSYRVTFDTPAFLGNAEQSGQWRTPPFKHLLREWWRVAWAERNDPRDWRRMREMEGKLFGHAWLENDHDSEGGAVSARRSPVRLRLTPWKAGGLTGLPKTRPVATKAPASGLYLGYGPVRGATKLKMRHPVNEGESAQLQLAWPKMHAGAEYMERMLALIHAFGTLGGRSRNGWGSLALSGDGLPVLEGAPLRDWRDCLREEWSHAIGADDRGALVWRTQKLRTEWKSVIEDLGPIRKQVNGWVSRKEREMINQPVGGRGGRLPNTLRFKVRHDEKDPEKLYGLIFHMPCKPPEGFRLNVNSPVQVWQKVHGLLDGHEGLKRGGV